MSTKNDKSQADLINLSHTLLHDFGSVASLYNYWFTHSRREIDRYFKEHYRCSYYYAKQIFNNIFNFTDRTVSDFNKIRRKHIDETNLKKYGRTDVGKFGSKEHIAAIKNKYGVENVGQLDFVKEKIKQTNLEHCGFETNLQTRDFRQISSKKYLYNNIRFDSSWELALYIFAKDHGEEIIREPEMYSFVFKNKTHYYTPDFLYKNELIDIKGPQFIKNGKLINPFNPARNELYEQIYKCMLEHNVVIKNYKDIQFALDYAVATYGKEYLRSFKNK